MNVCTTYNVTVLKISLNNCHLKPFTLCCALTTFMCGVCVRVRAHRHACVFTSVFFLNKKIRLLDRHNRTFFSSFNFSAMTLFIPQLLSTRNIKYHVCHWYTKINMSLSYTGKIYKVVRDIDMPTFP